MFEKDKRYRYKAIYEDFVKKMALLSVEISELDEIFYEHINNTGDPHKLTAAQIDLGRVQNGRLGTSQEAIDGVDTGSRYYTTPKQAHDALDHHVLSPLEEHINTHDPHDLTLEQIEAWSKVDVQDLLDTYYDRGETTARSQRIGGETFDALYTRARTDLNASNITAGSFTGTNANRQKIAVGTMRDSQTLALRPDGYLTWRELRNIIPTYNPVVAIGPNSGSMGVSGIATYVNWMNANRNPVTYGYGEGTVGFLQIRNKSMQKWHRGNGSNQIDNSNNVFQVVPMQVRNNRWVG